jgi:stress responsive alpha/beta barrel protein
MLAGPTETRFGRGLESQPEAKGFAHQTVCPQGCAENFMTGVWKKSGWRHFVLGLCVAFAGAACSTTPSPPQPATHVVLIWMKHPDSPYDRARLIRGARTLQMMPGVVRVDTGRTVPIENDQTDRSFDLGVAITFRDRAALERYEGDPRRAAAMERYLGPLVRRYVVYDVSSR